MSIHSSHRHRNLLKVERDIDIASCMPTARENV